jgi:hypothetical protein
MFARHRALLVGLGWIVASASACTVGPAEPLEGGASTARAAEALTKRQAEVRIHCRIARIASARSAVLADALARIGATTKEKDAAVRLLSRQAVEVCTSKGEASAGKALSSLIGGVEQRFVASAPMLKGVGGVFLDVLLARVEELQDRCLRDATVDGDALTAADASFDRALGALALGKCRTPGGLVDPATPGADSFHQCVTDALRGGLDRGRTGCNLAGGVDVGDVETEVDGPQPDDGSGGVEIGEIETEVDESPPGGGSGGVEIGEIESEVGESPPGHVGIGNIETMVLGGASVVFGKIDSAVAQANNPWRAVGATIRGKVAHRNQMPRICPSLSTPAGALTFAASGGVDASASSFAYSDILRSCACATGGDAVDLDPTGDLGDECRGDRAARLSCIRSPHDDTGLIRSECARMLAEDNKLLLDRRASACFVVTCGDDRILSDDCLCASFGGGGGGGSSQDPCATVMCPPGSFPSPVGLSCRCEQDLGSVWSQPL